MKRLSDVTDADYAELLERMRDLYDCQSVQQAAQQFVDGVYGRFSASLVLLRLFMTVRYDQLPEEDRRFVEKRGRETNTIHLFHGAMPVFTLVGTRGKRTEWNDRRASSHFRCIPLVSTAFVSSLSMLSRQFASVGFDLSLVDEWEPQVAATGRADKYRGMLYIRDAGCDRDEQGRMIVPKQDFVAEWGVRTTFGFGSGYANHPALITLFAFTSETIEEPTAGPCADLLEAYIASTETLVGQGRLFEGT